MTDTGLNTLYLVKTPKEEENNYMLILTRKKDESIILDGKIEIKIIEIEDGKVKIGIDAPKDIDIMRKELYKKIEEENLAAVNHTSKLEDMKKIFNKNKD